MRILFDQGTPVPLRRHLLAHVVRTTFEMGWSQLVNGELLARVEEQFDAFVTTEQNLAGRRLAVLVLPFASWPKLQPHAASIAAAVDALQPGGYCEWQS